MQLQPISESKHDELLSLLNPLMDFMIANNYTYFLVAGKDGTCTRHARGDYYDLHGMMHGMMKTQPQVKAVLKEIVEDFEDQPLGK